MGSGFLGWARGRGGRGGPAIFLRRLSVVGALEALVRVLWGGSRRFWFGWGMGGAGPTPAAAVAAGAFTCLFVLGLDGAALFDVHRIPMDAGDYRAKQG